jgi:sporulation protein YlmC with PRC-barrel domain
MMKQNVLNVAAAMLGLTLAADPSSDAKGPPSVWLSSELIGMKVVSQEGADLGKIEDLVVRPGGKVSYAVLSFGEWHGVGDKLFAMPWTVLRTVEPDTAEKGSARSLVLPLDRERLEKAPGFDKSNWPTFANADWTADVDKYYAGDVNPNTALPVEATSRIALITWKATDLRGADVTTSTGQALGEIQGLAIDVNGRVSYATVSVGGFLGLNDRIVAVPWDSFTFSLAGKKGDEKVISLASTKQQLERAPEFKTGKSNGAAMCDPEWIQRVYEHFSCPAYWNRTGSLELEPKRSH